ncbi:hypothetical protein HK105_204359 [Polyrhizophydium stewartii]|uniref:Stress-response A/B barrel domain-containing protein n=1 Tax=Polyrhizophydium stewartii TaxID=2732419 RepID=A0ABR4N8T1_9FUNG
MRKCEPVKLTVGDTTSPLVPCAVAMVAKHVVLFKFKPETSPEAIKALEAGVRSLIRIPGVLSMDFGETFTTERSQGFTHVLVADFESRATQAVYDPHPLHVEVVKTLIVPIIAPGGIVVVDIEDPARATASA